MGFIQYFATADEDIRRRVWGATFQVASRGDNLIGDAPAEFDGLANRLTEEMPDRLQGETDPVARINIFGFPSQFDALKPVVLDFLGRVFEPGRKQSPASLRGYYFSSGTQEGTAIDQVLGAMGRSFGGEGTRASVGRRQELLPARSAEQGDLRRVRPGCRATSHAERRAATLRYGGYGADRPGQRRRRSARWR